MPQSSSLPPSPLSERTAVWRLAWPLILTNLLNVAVGVIDFKMVGAIGFDAIAAVGVARQVMMLIMVVLVAISGGASVLVAHACGAGDPARVGRVASRSVTFMLLTALLVVMPTGLLFARPILGWLGAEAKVVDAGAAYLRILFLGAGFTMFNFAVNGILLGVGRTKVSLVLLLCMNGLNVLFNYLFIFGAGPIPALGVTGAAIGTIAARAIASLAGIWILYTPRLPIQASLTEMAVFDIPLLKQILHIGGPRSLQGIVRNLSRIMIIHIVSRLPESTRAISAFSVGMQVRMISTFIGLAFMSAAMTRVGQNLGAGQPEQAEDSGWVCARLATGFMSVIALLFLLLPETIMAFFTDDASVIRMGRSFFMIIALSEPLMGLTFAMGGALRGGGDAFSPFLYASLSDLILVIAFSYCFAIVLQMGLAGIALGIGLGVLARAVPLTWRFMQGRWKSFSPHTETD